MDNNSIPEDWKNITDPALRIKAQKKAWEKANKEKRKASTKKYKQANKEKILEYYKKYYYANQDKIRAYREANKEKIKIQTKNWREKNLEHKKNLHRNYYKNNLEKAKLSNKLWAKKNAERKKILDKNYYEKNKEKHYLVNRVYRELNKEKMDLYDKNYRKINKKRLLANNSVYVKERRKTDVQFKLSLSLRARLNKAVRGHYKAGSAVKDLGCSIEELKKYLESKFQEGMAWENHAQTGWHIDHIKPLASFDLTDRNQLLQACHYTNLQPLWAKDNLSKGAKII
jgi:hypothetical protein